MRDNKGALRKYVGRTLWWNIWLNIPVEQVGGTHWCHILVERSTGASSNREKQESDEMLHNMDSCFDLVKNETDIEDCECYKSLSREGDIVKILKGWYAGNLHIFLSKHFSSSTSDKLKGLGWGECFPNGG